MNDNVNVKNNDMKGIAFIIVGIMTIVAAIAGASFAFFQVTATNNSVITGSSAYTANALNLTVTHSTNSTVGTKKLVPQLDAAVKTAANSTYKCVDGNSNAVCKQFTITIKNDTTTTFYLDGTMSLVAATMPNLKWSICTAANTCTSTTYYTKSSTSLGSTFTLAGGGSKTFYIVVWISETGAAQTDSGDFTGTVTFNGFTDSGKTVSGITSTIRS